MLGWKKMPLPCLGRNSIGTGRFPSHQAELCEKYKLVRAHAHLRIGVRNTGDEACLACEICRISREALTVQMKYRVHRMLGNAAGALFLVLLGSCSPMNPKIRLYDSAGLSFADRNAVTAHARRAWLVRSLMLLK